MRVKFLDREWNLDEVTFRAAQARLKLSEDKCDQEFFAGPGLAGVGAIRGFSFAVREVWIQHSRTMLELTSLPEWDAGDFNRFQSEVLGKGV